MPLNNKNKYNLGPTTLEEFQEDCIKPFSVMEKHIKIEVYMKQILIITIFVVFAIMGPSHIS